MPYLCLHACLLPDLQALSLQYHQMIQASFQALAHGNPHHAPTLNETQFLPVSSLISMQSQRKT